GYEVAAFTQLALIVVLPGQLDAALVGAFINASHWPAIEPEVRFLDLVAALVVAGRTAMVALLVQARLAIQPKVRFSEALAPLSVEVPQTGVAAVARPHRPTLRVDPGTAERLRPLLRPDPARATLCPGHRLPRPVEVCLFRPAGRL